MKVAVYRLSKRKEKRRRKKECVPFSAAELLPAHSPSLEQHVTFRGRGG